MVKWNKTADAMPEEGKPVFLCKEPLEDLGLANLGCIITTDEGEVGWFIGNDKKAVKVQARGYWAYVEEVELVVPMMQTDEELEPILIFF